MRSQSSKLHWLMAILVSGVFHLLVQAWTVPILNSGDDFYVLYTLAGGFGEAPTAFHQYRHLWHPLLGGPVAWLFQLWPDWNWYTTALLGLQFVSAVALVRVVLAQTGLWQGLLLSGGLLYFFLPYYQLGLQFTGTAILLGAAAAAWLFHVRERLRLSTAWPGLLLLLAGGLLRLHAAAFSVALLAPVLFLLLPARKRLTAFWMTGSVALLLVAAFWMQEGQYRDRNPRWAREEGLRQAFFYSANRPLDADAGAGVFRDSVEQAFFSRSFFYDLGYTPTERVMEVHKALARTRDFRSGDDAFVLRWIAIESRLQLLLTALLLAWIFARGGLRLWKPEAVLVLTIVTAYAVLFVWLKVTWVLHLSFFFLLCTGLLLTGLSLPAAERPRRWFTWFLALPLVLAVAWNGKKVAEYSGRNAVRRQEARCVLSALKRRPDNLFVATDDVLPLSGFSIWDLPAHYPLPNLVYQDRLLTGTYVYTLKRFDIPGLMDALYQRRYVYLLGPAFPELETYFTRRGVQVRMIDIPMGPSCLEVRQLQP